MYNRLFTMRIRNETGKPEGGYTAIDEGDEQ